MEERQDPEVVNSVLVKRLLLLMSGSLSAQETLEILVFFQK
jgi:hypothetical protein